MPTTAIFATSPELAAECMSMTEVSETVLLTTGPESPDAYRNFGAKTVVHFSGESTLPEAYANDIATWLIQNSCSLFVVAGDTTGREIASHVAGLIDAPMVSEATTVRFGDGSITVEHLIYGGAVIRTERLMGVCVLSLAPGSNDQMPTLSIASPLTVISADPDSRVQLVGEKPIERESVDLTKAERIVCAGMAFTTKEELETAYALASALNAEVGCTRGLAENNHWFSDYIGLSGIAISPKLYLSLGVSGQVQHSVGMRGSQVVVAVNKDKSAQCFNNCDYGIVGDLFDIVPAIINAL